MTDPVRIETRLLAPEPYTIWGDDAVQSIVGQPIAVGVDIVDIGPQVVLPEGFAPQGKVVRAWVDDEGWLCAEVEIDYFPGA